ncbi:hypothetical protein HPB50_014535 [Hyalomma asiaticum]|uniref:Uncharacterized protein n=1 Tax=Hyalomma asiaticum TaxID=266040 RepID=A0ACB7RR21_HYAAI|nr:hypothetical protein HPB50_014535 [Hyalomma asiaticum]
MSDKLCMRKFGENGYNTTLQFCAYDDTTDACEGDSGGPAIARANNRRFLQVGIVSYGAGCADNDVPGVYTRLDALVPWILDNILYGTWLILQRYATVSLLLMVNMRICACIQKDRNEEYSTSHRSPRWGFFNWIEFANEPCVSRNGFSGVCLTSSECNFHGGVANGRCAQGYGVCCQVSRSCGEMVTRNNSYFVDPASVGGSLTPGPNGVLCSVTVYKADPTVCQLRLNMERFDVIGPDVSPVSGVCSHDAFHVSGQDENSVVPLICGVNNGQHVYVSVSQSNGPVRLSMFLAPNATHRNWRIRVIQLACGSQRLAPSGCLQYHEDPTGLISSFNYGSDSTSAGSGSGRMERGYPNFSRYSICFRLAAGTCSLRLAKDGPFGVYAEPAQGYIPEVGRKRMVTNRCEEFGFRSPLQADFLMLGVQPFCGDDFPDSLEMVDTGAVLITFVANGTHRPEYAGFRLRYQMVPCVRHRHGADVDSATRVPGSALFFHASTTRMPHASSVFPASSGFTSTSSGGLQQEFPTIPEPEVYTESGYFPEHDVQSSGGQIVLYHKGVDKDLAMKIVRNLVAVAESDSTKHRS